MCSTEKDTWVTKPINENAYTASLIMNEINDLESQTLAIDVIVKPLNWFKVLVNQLFSLLKDLS